MCLPGGCLFRAVREAQIHAPVTVSRCARGGGWRWLTRAVLAHSMLTAPLVPRLRLANEETKQRAETAQDTTSKSTDARLSILDADAPPS